MGVRSYPGNFLTGMLLLTLVACAGFQPDAGDAVAEAARIELKAGEVRTGTWQGRHLKVHYDYSIERSQMAIEGRVAFPRRKLIDTFLLEVNVTDADGGILATEVLVMAPYRKMIETLAFEKTIDLPAGFDAMVFSYSGASRGIGEGAGSQNRFWQSP